MNTLNSVLTFAKPECDVKRFGLHDITLGLSKPLRKYGKECYIIIVIHIPFQHTGLKWQ